MVDLILGLCGYRVDRDLASKMIIEPACGSGAFLVPVVERLAASAARYGADLRRCEGAIRAFDLLGRNVAASRAKVASTLIDAAALDPQEADRLASRWVQQGDFLLEGLAEGSADFVVGNPPYIRLESIPPARMAAYRAACPTMIGRADIYVGFYERGLFRLAPRGAARLHLR